MSQSICATFLEVWKLEMFQAASEIQRHWLMVPFDRPHMIF